MRTVLYGLAVASSIACLPATAYASPPDASLTKSIARYFPWLFKTYDDCIIEHMHNSSNKSATQSLELACRHKYKENNGTAYDDCILENIQAVNDDTAVSAIVASCQGKYGQDK